MDADFAPSPPAMMETSPMASFYTSNLIARMLQEERSETSLSGTFTEETLMKIKNENGGFFTHLKLKEFSQRNETGSPEMIEYLQVKPDPALKRSILRNSGGYSHPEFSMDSIRQDAQGNQILQGNKAHHITFKTDLTLTHNVENWKEFNKIAEREFCCCNGDCFGFCRAS